MADILRRHVLLLTVAAVLFSTVPVSNSIPFILLHGLGDKCSGGVSNFTQLLTMLSGSPGACLEIGNGKRDSWFMSLTDQASLACEKVKMIPGLSQGYNIVAESQGNMVARGLIEFCDDAPPVINYVSLGGPHAGIAALPKCPLGRPLCSLLETFISFGIYNGFVQDHFAPSGFVKIPGSTAEYLEYSHYLPKLNNERPNQRNSTFKDRFTSLHNLVLVKFQDDTILIPHETSWFAYLSDDVTSFLTTQQTKLYIEDWIGLKALDEAGKVKFVSVPGEHLMISHDDVVKYVVPYLMHTSS